MVNTKLKILSQNLILFLITLALIMTSGSNTSIIFLAMSVMLAFFRETQISSKNIFTALLFIFLLYLNSYVFAIAPFDSKEFMVYVVRFISLAILATYISYERFFEIYVRILYVVFCITLVLWAVLFIFNNIGLRGVLSPAIMDYFMMDSTSQMLRLKAIFWEGGVCATHANIGLTYCIIKGIDSKKLRNMAIVFILAVICSVSTTGYIVLVLQVALYLYRNCNEYRIPKKVMVLLMVALIVFLIEEITVGVIVGKIFGGQHSFTSRFDDTYLALLIAKDNFWTGIGVATDTQVVFLDYFYNSLQYKSVQKYFAPDLASSNGLGNCMYKAGVLFTIVYICVIFFKLKERMRLRKFEAILITMMYICYFIGEPIMSTPMMLMFFFSIRVKEKEKICHDYNGGKHENVSSRYVVGNRASI